MLSYQTHVGSRRRGHTSRCMEVAVRARWEFAVVFVSWSQYYWFVRLELASDHVRIV